MENPTNPGLVNERPKVTSVVITKTSNPPDPLSIFYTFTILDIDNGYDGDFWVKFEYGGESTVLKFSTSDGFNEKSVPNEIFGIEHTGNYPFKVSVSIADSNSGFNTPYLPTQKNETHVTVS